MGANSPEMSPSLKGVTAERHQSKGGLIKCRELSCHQENGSRSRNLVVKSVRTPDDRPREKLRDLEIKEHLSDVTEMDPQALHPLRTGAGPRTGREQRGRKKGSVCPCGAPGLVGDTDEGGGADPRPRVMTRRDKTGPLAWWEGRRSRAGRAESGRGKCWTGTWVLGKSTRVHRRERSPERRGRLLWTEEGRPLRPDPPGTSSPRHCHGHHHGHWSARWERSQDFGRLPGPCTCLCAERGLVMGSSTCPLGL